ncbi:hatching enzyme 1.2-like [Oratosquilla oratoria]|uniref:hatching enzyme 1.2-like n=1 Tax=Oratosquilla oratoria TaxID=337810 RepID=UPI003F760AD3
MARVMAVVVTLQVAIGTAIAVPLSIDMALQLETRLDPPQDVTKRGGEAADEKQQDVDEDMDPEVTPGFYQGDMAGVLGETKETRLGVRWEIFPERRWENNTVPYVISSKYLPAERRVIETAIATLNFMTCVRFIPWDGKVEDYLLICPSEKPSGCWSFVGKQGGKQLLSLQRPTRRSHRCLGTVGKPIHELLHAIGIFHEQSRSDRDDHVIIIEENINTDFLHNFDKQSDENTTYSYDYDYNSVMHYGSHFFSKARNSATIVPRVPGVRIGQRLMLSSTDCLKVNLLYGCLDQDVDSRTKYEAFCNFLGL